MLSISSQAKPCVSDICVHMQRAADFSSKIVFVSNNFEKFKNKIDFLSKEKFEIGFIFTKYGFMLVLIGSSYVGEAL